VKALIAHLILVLVAGTLAAQGTATRILIVYQSDAGHTAAMATAIAAGARSIEGVEVVIEEVEKAEPRQVLDADAVIVGSPVYNANVAPRVQEFINRWPIDSSALRNKVGAAFVTGGGISAGEEAVQISILRSMLIFGMVIVGGPEWTSAFGASAVTEEPPFDPRDGKPLVEEMFLRKGRALGQRVAEVTRRWKLNRAADGSACEPPS
jgi:NAD(P)H dehydrogenase (quinone)